MAEAGRVAGVQYRQRQHRPCPCPGLSAVQGGEEGDARAEERQAHEGRPPLCSRGRGRGRGRSGAQLLQDLALGEERLRGG